MFCFSLSKWEDIIPLPTAWGCQEDLGEGTQGIRKRAASARPAHFSLGLGAAGVGGGGGGGRQSHFAVLSQALRSHWRSAWYVAILPRRGL